MNVPGAVPRHKHTFEIVISVASSITHFQLPTNTYVRMENNSTDSKFVFISVNDFIANSSMQ